MSDTANQLLAAIAASTSPFHAAREAIRQLKEAGFMELSISENWNIRPGECYYVCPFGTTVIAFRVNEEFCSGDMLKITAAHLDSPGPRLKANPAQKSGGYLRFNTEIYGGAIFNTWLDRPLSMAGRIFVRGGHMHTPAARLIDFKRPIAVIPNLPVHLNRKVNEGISLNEQSDLLPVLGLEQEASGENFLESLLAAEAGLSPQDILSWELCFYNACPGSLLGLHNEFITAPRIDNISSVQACLTGLIESRRPKGIDIIALFDHEEIGSRTKNGAGSLLFSNLCERIYDALSLSRCDYLKAVSGGLFLSLDVAHGLHPSHPEKYDPTSAIALGEGVALKTASRQNYCGDGEIHGILTELCRTGGIPLKNSHLRSDQPGGSTLGSLLSVSLPMRCADLGIPVLAMHSSCETMCIRDQEALEKLVSLFYSQL